MKGWHPAYPGEVPSLGPDILQWMRVLPSPGDPAGKARLLLTDEQAVIIIRIYAIDPLTGLPLYRRTELEQPKGWGKSPLAAAISLAELCGPVVFDGWDANGRPVGRPWGTVEGSPPPWVQIAAVSEDQTDNTYSALYSMLTADQHRAASELRIDHGRTRLYLLDRPGAKLEPVTASFGTREGQRVTFGVLDETFLWTQRNGGVKLARTIRRNVAKMNGRTIETTNAPMLGENSVAEQTSETHEPGVLHIANRPSQEPMPDWDDERLRAELDRVYGDARWIDRGRILAEVRDTAGDWSDSLRFYFNTRAAGASRAVDPRLWESRKVPGQPPPAGTRIGLGFDGSVSRDETFLGGCTAEGWGFVIERWARPPGASRDWTIPRLEVEAAVDRAFATWSVGLMVCDPPFWRTEIQGWERQYGEEVVIALDTNQPSRFAPAVERWRTGLETGAHTHSGDPDVTRHVLDARLRKVHLRQDDDDGRTRFVLIKGSSGDRIDGAVMDVLAYEAAMTMPTASDDGPSIYETRGALVLGAR